ncbi:PilZ domain-containing protein [Shewanella sp. Isolate11]|uniref:PilZ domain-containing protein n=1 Tax=Shewanella sp. Isolate11 TaxID=2908530 RepID=UPI001EFC5B27|nr:PilZ domain-containing protein [Shewanella sp. Isolate11]MCG9697316.1 PilZ domain-containing protein [Shewanella sp. Isolate11]
MDNRRQFSRVIFAADAILSDKHETWPTKIQDLSLNGALVEQPAGFSELQTPLTLSFKLAESDIVITMETQLVHKKNGLLGLQCLHIDIDSISHLRRMLELNLGDASLLDRELKMLFAS